MGCSVSVLCQMARADHLVMTQSHWPVLLLSLTLCCSLLCVTCMNTFVPGCELFPMLLLSLKQLSGVHFISIDMYGEHAKSAIYMGAVFFSCIAVQPGVILSDEAKTSLRGWRGVLPRMGACRIAQDHFLPA